MKNNPYAIKMNKEDLQKYLYFKRRISIRENKKGKHPYNRNLMKEEFKDELDSSD